MPATIANVYPWRRTPEIKHIEMHERFILAIRQDFGCLAIVVLFLVVMVSSIYFANIITPPSSNPFV